MKLLAVTLFAAAVVAVAIPAPSNDIQSFECRRDSAGRCTRDEATKDFTCRCDSAGRCTRDTNADARNSFASDPLASDPLASDPLTSDPLASDPLASDPLASDPLASDPLASDLLASDPLASQDTQGLTCHRDSAGRCTRDAHLVGLLAKHALRALD